MRVKRFRAILFLAAVSMVTSAAQARINVLEPWHPGIDASVGVPTTHKIRAAFISGENFFEVPAEFNYVTANNIEVGGRWGIKGHSGNIGISDLILGGKYVFIQETSDTPAVLGEAAFSLPTGNFSDGLGTGSMDFSLHWAAVKKINDYKGTFGIGMRLNSENSDKFSAGNVFFYHVGASYPLQSDLTVYGELKGFMHGNSKFNAREQDDEHRELYLAPGIDYALDGKWTLNCALLIGLTNSSSDLGLLIGTKF